MLCQGNVSLAGMERRESELLKTHPMKALAKAMGISRYSLVLIVAAMSTLC